MAGWLGGGAKRGLLCLGIEEHQSQVDWTVPTINLGQRSTIVAREHSI